MNSIKMNMGSTQHGNQTGLCVAYSVGEAGVGKLQKREATVHCLFSSPLLLPKINKLIMKECKMNKLLLLLRHFSRVRLCATPEIAAHQAPTPVPGILQARTLEWVAISFSNAGKWKVQVKSLSCVQLLATPWTAALQAPPSMGFSRHEYWSKPSPKWTRSLMNLLALHLRMYTNS